MSVIERIIRTISPGLALRRARLRSVLAVYEAAQPTTLRNPSRDNRGPNLIVGQAGGRLRDQSRYHQINHDLVRGALRALANNVAGPNGVGIEPQPKTFGGEVHEEFAEELRMYHEDWSRRPEVTGVHTRASLERFWVSALARDGEIFAQILVGKVAGLDHGTLVPLSLEIIEPDHVPFDYNDATLNVQHGIERNAWGAARGYYVYKNHPGEYTSGYAFGGFLRPSDMKRIPGPAMIHHALRDRIRQVRGVSELASVLTRLDDLKDYEESERIAAKIAASMCAVIRKGSGDLYDAGRPLSGSAQAPTRDLRFQPGMVFDDLLPGESVDVINSDRPNPNLKEYRNGQLRAAAAGLGVSYSSLARDYNGTYSAQRQELVEQSIHYEVLQGDLIAQFTEPCYRLAITAAIGSGLLQIPADINPATLYDAVFRPQSMPWIDPENEADANVKLDENQYISPQDIIRKGGRDPRQVLNQRAQWKRWLEQRGLNDAPQATREAPAQENESAAMNGDATAQMRGRNGEDYVHLPH